MKDTLVAPGTPVLVGRAANIAVGLLICATGVGFILQATTFPIVASGGAPGPARLPIIYASLLCLVGAVLFFRALRDPPPRVSVSLDGTAKAGILAVSVIVYAALLPLLGFIPASLAWFFAAVFFLERRWRPAAFGAVILVSGIFVIFRNVLSVPLP